jgi:hypothetical protein
MKKIQSLFQRNHDGDRQVRNEVVPGSEWVSNGEGRATVKLDGTSCMIKNGFFYKRYDAKKGKTPPPDFIPAQDPDPITGHWPGWLPVGSSKEDRWHMEGWKNSFSDYAYTPSDGTFELVGPKINGNKEKEKIHRLYMHGNIVPDNPQPPRDFDGLKEWFKDREIEGIVWHHPDGRMVKIKRKDFGYKW